MAEIWTAYTLVQQKLENFTRSGEILKIQDGGRPPSWIYQNVNNFRVDWAFWLKFGLNIPWRNRNWKISPECEFWKSKMAAGRRLEFTKMLINSAWIELFGWNLDWIYLGITEIGKFHKKAKFWKSKMAACRHLEFTKMLITSRVDWAF